MTVWDGGGNDTYDLSNYTTDLSIELAPGGWTTTDTSANHLQRADLGDASNLSAFDPASPPDTFARWNIANALPDPNNPSETASYIESAVGGTGNDTLKGNAVDNRLTGNSGSDILVGFGGNDSLFGGSGNDQLFGDSGSGSISLGSGTLTKSAGAGNRSIATAINISNLFSLAANPDISDATGTPHVSITGNGDGTVDYYAVGINNAGSAMTLDIDHTVSLDSWVTVFNSAGTELVHNDDSSSSNGAGGSTTGSDSFLTYTFDAPGTYYFAVGKYSNLSPIDTGSQYVLQVSVAGELLGNAGSDFLDGGAGADTIDGGDSFDIATWLNETSGLTLNFTNQTLNADSAAGDNVSNVEAFYLTNFADQFTGGNSFVFVYGFAGNDTITGSSVSDIIDGGPGADTINAGGGFDYVSYYSSANAVTVNLKNPASNTGDAQGDVVSNAEAFILTQKNDTFVGADSGQNIAFGYEGNDTFTGGFNANNWFFAGDGNDRMVGGGVSDLFVGGAGADTIVLATPTPIAGSSVLGFTPGEDHFEISRSAFGLSAGYAVTDGTTFVSGTAPTASTTQATFLYYTNAGLLYFDPDGSASHAATLLAQLDANTALHASDFNVV
jgi:serralysin